MSTHNAVVKPVEALPPKIFVALSLTPRIINPFTSGFPRSSWVFPAILDTGCNSVVEIDERQLTSWTDTPKTKFNLINRHDSSESDRPYDIRTANIWLHRTLYKGPRFVASEDPILLKETGEIFVMDKTATRGPVPRFPLIGLKALLKNSLRLHVDGASGTFAILGEDH